MGSQPATTRLRLVTPRHEAEHDVDADRRAYPRCTLAELPWVREVRLKYGPRAAIIDLSAGGAQLETRAHRLAPGSTVVVELKGDETESRIPSRVVRCHIAALAPLPTYRFALEFKRRFALPGIAAGTPRLGADADLAREHARLLQAARRFDGAGIDTMSTVLAMIDTPAVRRAGDAFARELATLFTIMTRGIEEGAPEDVLAERLVERLRHTVPVRAIRVTDTLAVSTDDAVWFDVPVNGHEPSAKLVVEFPRDFRSEEWQFQYLKASAYFFAFVRQIRRKATAVQSAAAVGEVPRVEAPRPIVTTPAPPSLHRVVVRYRDGRLLKGYAHAILPVRGAVEVWRSPNTPSASRVIVPFAQLKAVFFVRDFEGDASYDGGKSSTSTANVRGRKVAITFVDGEELAGATLGYQSEGPGFFLYPLDARSNNRRVFVVSQAIRHIQFP